MEFDDLQKAWKSQDTGPRITIKPELLLKEVRRNQRQFWATIFWRDVREVSVAFLLAVYFLYDGWWHHNWTNYISALACAGIGLFMVADRLRQKAVRPAFNHALKECIQASLNQVNHQIWLLKNVFWWYLLPLLITSAISMSYTNLHIKHFNRGAAIGAFLVLAMVVWIFRFVYRLNMSAVQRNLEPRRQELEELLGSLNTRNNKRA